jgi:cell division GTPase FtsZ
MKQKIGFICIGQAGGNIGQLLEQHSFNCLFINTSKEDLETLNTKFRYHILNGEGCNHNREKAISLLKNDYTNVIQEVKDKLSHQQLIYLIFSTGGGSGSGISPILLEMLNSQLPNKKFGCITILPSDQEIGKPHMNSYKCYQELSSIDKLASVFTLDNNKLDNKFQINAQFVNKFVTLLDIPNHINTKGNIDKAELWEMLITRGSAIFTIINSNSSNSQNLTTSIIKSWESNIFADIEKDKNIMYLGLSLTSDIFIDDLKLYIGTPYDIFRNYNRDTNVTILSGLTFPKTRINKIIESLNSNKEKLTNNIQNSRTNKITESLDWINNLESEPTNNNQSLPFETNLNEIFSKYT